MFIEVDTSVKNIMTSNIHFVRPDTLMSEVSELFRCNDFHHLPVLDATGGVLGIISKGDYLQLQNHFTRLEIGDYRKKNDRFLNSLTAEEVMTSQPVCINLDATIGMAMRIFLENLFHALPVIDGNICVGIITPYDILAYLNHHCMSLNE